MFEGENISMASSRQVLPAYIQYVGIYLREVMQMPRAKEKKGLSWKVDDASWQDGGSACKGVH
jgi:hypothetical protein